MSDNSSKYPDFIETCGFGLGEGICGWNCRHSFSPYDERIGNPWRDKDGNLIDGAGNRIDSEESKQKYLDSQRLRAIERDIRSIKRQLVVKEQLMQGADEEELQRLQPEYDKLAYELTQQNKKYNDFAKEHSLTPQYGRNKLADFGREQERRANAGARRYSKTNVTATDDNLSANDSEEPKPANIVQGILHGKEVKDFTKTAKQINIELDSICIRESRWSGRIIIDGKLGALGQKEWNCDIKLVPKADYATELHELLHARSASYYDAKTYKKYRKMEEGTVELLTEEICKKKEIGYTSTYEEEIKHLRRINRRAKLYVDEYSFAVDLLNIPLVDRSKWLIKKINDNCAKGMLSEAEREGAFDSLVKILEEVD